jgi:hypothetical protein
LADMFDVGASQSRVGLVSRNLHHVGKETVS